MFAKSRQRIIVVGSRMGTAASSKHLSLSTSISMFIAMSMSVAMSLSMSMSMSICQIQKTFAVEAQDFATGNARLTDEARNALDDECPRVVRLKDSYGFRVSRRKASCSKITACIVFEAGVSLHQRRVIMRWDNRR